jgi:alpha-L-fucosidase
MSGGRGAWFKEARFGMFIHWGLYSILGRGEWVMYLEHIPVEEYSKLSEKFKPTKFNPDEWVSYAKEAGMRYMVLTSRHHDGFSLFDSKVSDYTAAKTAAGRDLVAEFIKACHKAGMRVGLYYSLLDWRWPEYWKGPKKDPEGWSKFLDYVHTQVEEICSNYGRLDVLWYDGAWPYKAEDWRSAELNAKVRKLQPEILINNRSGLPEDFDTPEQHVSFSPPGRLWESCMTTTEYFWGYCKGDAWRSTRRLIQTLVTCASGEGNLLLNVGPKADGTFPARAIRILREIGSWMKVNGESIYGSERCPFSTSVGTFTAKGSKVYVHVFRWPGREVCIAGVGNDVKDAYMLATGEYVKFSKKDGRVLLKGLPARAPDPYDTVIVLELDGKPQGLTFRVEQRL